MANREALRELQARLATRLQAAQSEGMSVAWLAVNAGGANYLLPLGQSGEIFPVSNLQPVPYSKPWFTGVLNIRGSLYGVVDLGDFVCSSSNLQRGAPTSVEASVVTLNPLLEVNCAVRVDALSGLRGSEAFAASTPPAIDAPDYFGNCFVDSAGVSWQEINLRVLAQSPQFLNISA
jgi:twitching motility protein PilI